MKNRWLNKREEKDKKNTQKDELEVRFQKALKHWGGNSPWKRAKIKKR